MLPETDWSRLYYALVSVQSTMKVSAYRIYGLGKTLDEAKLNGMEYLCKNREITSSLNKLRYDKFVMLDLNTRAYHSNNMHSTYYTMMYVEAKIYEYSKVWNVLDFELILDPTVKENVLRLVRVRKNGLYRHKFLDEDRYRYRE